MARAANQTRVILAFRYQCILCRAHCFRGERNTAIDGRVQDNFANLFVRRAVVAGTAHMPGQFVLPTERRQHCHRDQAALLESEDAPAPHRSPGVFGDEFLQRAAEVGRLGEGLIDKVIPHHLSANREALFVRVIHVYFLHSVRFVELPEAR